ncbi:hypothetical protein DUI87_17644 [Hirundo rustica rustica]|uniref:Phospholipase A2-like central domain-containing protein n=1 Tax=Hirundo rustica rustica TaxID=333673 RepID=A0A3M0JYW3_HIRRU|nr:hypothetical protein DUI87_17644 [Hirundo rustica rustica]
MSSLRLTLSSSDKVHTAYPLSPGCWGRTVESPHALLPQSILLFRLLGQWRTSRLARQLENKGQAGSVSLEGSKQQQQVRNLCGKKNCPACRDLGAHADRFAHLSASLTIHQCWAQITALQFNYGIRNYRLHTVSHCDCDARFRRCLLAINDTVSNIIGITFFNLLEVPCFVLEESEECVQWHWWGGLTKCLRRERDCSDMDVAVLADHIAMDCFVLEMPAACSPGRGSQHRLVTPQLGGLSSEA